MKVIETSYTRRFNTGEYNFEEYTLTAELDEGETGAMSLCELREEVLEAHTGSKPTEEKKEKKKNGKSKTNSSKDADEDGEDSSKQDSGDDGEGDQDNEATDNEAGDDDNDSAESGEDSAESEDSDEEETKPGKGKGGAKGKSSKDKDSKETGSGKKFKKKPQQYDRSIEQHKEIFSGVLKSVSPDWKKTDASKKKAKKASELVEGEAFLDENGEVLAEFTTRVRKLMK